MKTHSKFAPRTIAVAVSLLFASPVLANPTGAQVVNGAVSISRPNASTLNITNSPGAIINWQGFSIGAGEVTRFIQQSASSAVLNRVVGPDISAIQGQLLSNGRVFLVNPAGIIIGPNAMIDTAGFVGSALNMSNADFLAGKLRFSGDANSGSVINQGWIRTSFGGNVLLVAPNIENSALIQTPGGELILAAGQKLTVSSMEQGGVQFEVQAPTDSVLNVGKLLADGGAVGVFAGTLKHSGEIRANALVRDAAGQVVLQAAKDVSISGSVAATSNTGKGGGITVTGERVTAANGAVFDVSGGAGGGQILLGGDYQGANAAVRNATTTFVGNATLRADATNLGDGGRIIVWGDDSTRFTGSISAQGGQQGGNGGFAEVSGRNNLFFGGTANLSAPKGTLGTLLLDPLDLYVAATGGVDAGAGKTNTSTLIDEATDFPSSAVTVAPATLAGIAGNVVLHASRYLRFSNDVTLTTAGQSLTATVGKYTAPALPDPNALDVNNTPNRLDIAANITTNNGAINLNAPLIQTVAASKFTTTGGAITLTSGTNLSTNALTLDAGAGAVTLAVGADPLNFLQTAAVTGGTVTATAPAAINMGVVTTGAGALTLTSSGSSVNTGNLVSTGGAINISALASSINSAAITGGGGTVTLAAKTNIFTGAIDTTGAVALSATAGSINSTVNNASKLTASAANTFNSASVNINSTTALNADNVTVNVSNCLSSTSCPGASINLTATGNINIGTLTANAPATTNNAAVFNNSIARSVTLTSNGGSILATGSSSLITATDVTLRTQQGSGGGIGTAATAVNVNVERLLDLRPNGDFNVAVSGAGPTRLTTQLGVAATGKTYTGNLTSGSLNFNASATDTAVTVGKFTATGLTQRLYGQNPSIDLSTPNGALTVTTMSVPEGDTRPNDPPPVFASSYTNAALPVNISATGALTINNYTRNITGASLPKSTAFSSSGGSVTLGTISAGKDTVTVTASGTGSNAALTDISTAGNVTVTANNGDVTVGRIDTTSGTGNVSVSASTSAGSVKSATDSAALEVTSGGTVSLTGRTLGTGGFANPFDVAGTSVTLTSTGAAGGAIGFAGAPLIANTQTLTVNASPSTAAPAANGATFNVSTGALALTTLNVTANPQAVGVAGPSTVTTDGGKGVYTLLSDGTNFTFNPGVIPAAQFVKGALNITANSGNFTLGAVDMGTQGGNLSITARNGSITAATVDGLGAISLSAGQSTGGTDVTVTAGNIGAINRPSSVTMAAGNNNFTTSRGGTVTLGNVEAGGLSISTFTGGITVGNVGALARAGSVSLIANERSGSGKISTGTITASGLTTSSRINSTTTGDIDVTGSVSMTSENTVSLGNVTASSFNIGPSFFAVRPVIVTNNIKGVQSMSLFGSTTTVNGTVTGDAAGTGQLFIGGSSGMVTITGNSVIAGDGSTIAIDSQGTKAFEFQTLNAGAKGIVSVASPAGIQQNAGGTGVTGVEVALSAITAGKSILQAGGDGKLDINGTQKLTINAGGPVAIDGNGSTLTNLTINKTQAPGAAAFDLSALGGGQVVTLGGAADLALTVQSAANPLNFSLDYNVATSNVALAGAGINSGGGNVALTIRNGAFDGTVGGIVTGGAKGGGAVTVSSTGLLSTGAINTTPTGAGTGGAINAAANGAGMTITGDLRTGTGGDAIGLSASTGSITRSGGAQIISDTSVSVSATINTGAVDVGASATPLLITSPSVSLTAGGFPVGGSVFATLTNTKTLNLSADNGFAVTSSTPFDTLSVATRGAGTGVMTLTAPGQTYTFARPAVDLFGGALANTFQVIAAAGATPAANATFVATSGDLFVGGPGTNITTPTLTLHTNGSGGDVKLQGTAANPLVLNNTTQNIGNGFSTRDVLVRGNVTLTGNTQNLSVARGITVQAEQGSINLSAVDQSITTETVTKGTILFKGGAGAGEAVTVSASKTQLIQSPTSGSAAGIRVEGGDGAGSTASVLYNGTGTQTVQGGGTVSIVGGKGNNAFAEIRTATGNQFVSSETNLDITGGASTGSSARIINTGSGSQQVGESRQSGFFVFSYQTDNMTLTAGAGNDAIAEISAAGAQQIHVRSGTLTLQGGGANAFARIDNTAASEQLIGCATYLGGCGGGGIGIINVLAGAATGAYARITGTGTQRITSNSQINLTGATTDASATITGAGQDIRTGTTTLLAGAGKKADALIQSSTTQNLQGGFVLTGGGSAGAVATAQVTATGNQTIAGAGAFNLTGGVSDNSLVRIASGGNQSINFSTMSLAAGQFTGALAEITATGTQSLNGGGLTMTAGGTPITTVPVASVTILGNSQTISAGAIVINGGAGIGEGGDSNAVIRNLLGNQAISASSSITLNGGTVFSTTGIVNAGTGTQTITSKGAITLQTLATNTASAPVMIQNIPATEQKLTANGGGLTLSNQGKALISVTTAGTQTVTSLFIDVHTASGSTGNSLLTATGNQWLRTTDGSVTATGSLRVAALGTGLANIESGASQLIELDYPGQMQGLTRDGRLTVGDAAAAGRSRIGAVDQTIFAKSALVQTGGLGAGTQSEIKSTGKQVISLLNGNLQVLGGSGANSLAQIDPVDQNILVNGGVDVIGGSGANALAQITSTGTQTLFATNGNILVQGGSGAGANASITAAGVQSLSASGNVTALNGTGGTGTITGVAAPASNNGASSLSSTPSGTVIALNDTQAGVVTESEPEDNPNNNDPLRRAPICF